MIHLACTREELSAMEPFTETQFIESTRPSYQYTGDARVMEMPYVVPDEFGLYPDRDRAHLAGRIGNHPGNPRRSHRRLSGPSR